MTDEAGVEKAVDFLVEQARRDMLEEIKREARQGISLATHYAAAMYAARIVAADSASGCTERRTDTWND